ncbi:hypothetical protein HYX19_01505 [Candidatus Woesearchaeota archaeon]|nr:hypothetical protein [Candidatus Woesearchaeota archaeon]
MDILAHGLWTYAIFHKTKSPKLAVLFGVLPDLISFTPFFITRILSNQFKGRPNLAEIPNFVTSSYNFTHSLVIAIVAIILITLIMRRFYTFLLGWPLHILIDIPTHEATFFPTPFLYPISDLHISSVSWGRPEMLAMNYFALLLVYAFLVKNRIKHDKRQIRTNT